MSKKSEPSIFFSDANERQGSFLRRTLLFGGGTALGVTILGARLGQIQVVQAAEYSTLAASNQFNFRLVPPPRGRIMDRHGVVLAGNRPSFRVLVVRDEIKDLDQTLDYVGQILPDTLERRRAIIRDVNAAPRFSPVPVKSDLTWEEFSKVNLHAGELPGVMADMNEARYYPHGGAFAHVVGYVAKIAAEDVDAMRARGETVSQVVFNPAYRIGRMGVEKALDAQLRGEAGGNRVEVDARGRVVAEDQAGSRPAIPGKDVVVTLDADIQKRALEVFGEESGACVVMDVRNGDILCMSSAPAFDPNLFVSGVPSSIYRAWADYERRPLLDKATTGTYAPGSTFKPVVGMAAMLRGANPARVINCSGGYYLGRRFACHARHGPQDMRAAIKNSCNVYFMTLAVEMGPDAIAESARQFGFGHEFDIGIGGQKEGIVPDRDWKRRNFKGSNQTWWPGETPSYGIGQGALTVNALQLAVYTARMANGRESVLPRLIHSVGGVEQPRQPFAPLPFPAEMTQVLRDGMNAVTEAGGTAFRNSQLGLGAVRMAGKTGTAQVRNYGPGSRKGAGQPWAMKDHNLFIAYAPIDNPRYAMSVIVQHGGMGGGTAAAPRAREVMRVALLKDAEMRERIERNGFVETQDPGAHEVPEALAPETPAAPAAAATPQGPRPYLSEPRG